MKWEGFDGPDLAGFSSMSDNEENNEGWEDTTSQQYPHVSRDFARRAMAPKQEEIDFNGSFGRDSEFVTSLHFEDDVSSSRADRAVVNRRSGEMGVVSSVLGCDEQLVLRDHHQQPFVTRGRSRSLIPQSSSLPRCARRKTFTLESATKILFDVCEEQHLEVG